MADRMAWGGAWQESGKVFTRENGDALHPATVTDRFHALARPPGCRRSGCMIFGMARRR